jgi:putative transcriptional regulator
MLNAARNMGFPKMDGVNILGRQVLLTQASRNSIISLMDTTFSLRNRIREVRKRLKLRQSDLADGAGVTRQTIIAIEKSRLNPSVSLSLRIARILQEPVEYLFYLEVARDGAHAAEEADVQADATAMEPVEVLEPDAAAAKSDAGAAGEPGADDQPIEPVEQAPAARAETPATPEEVLSHPPVAAEAHEVSQTDPETHDVPDVEPSSPEIDEDELGWLAGDPPKQAPVVSEDDGSGQAIWDFV